MPTAGAGAEMAGIDYMRALVAGEMPPPPIAVTMRFAPVEVEVGRAAFEGVPGEEHYNPIGVVHGGYASTLLDSAAGCAVHTTLAAGEAYTTLTLEVKMVRPILKRHGPGPRRGRGHPPRPAPGDRRGEALRGRDRQAPRARRQHLHDPLATRRLG